MSQQYATEKTVICRACYGEGGKTHDLETFYVVYGREWKPCPRCQGSGRLVKKTTYAPAPFGPAPATK